MVDNILSIIALIATILAIFLAKTFNDKTNEILRKIDENVNQIVDAISDREDKKKEVFESIKNSNINIISEPKIGFTIPDFIIEQNSNKIPVEIKNFPKKVIANELINKLRNQMHQYMVEAESKISFLIIFAPEITDRAYDSLRKNFQDGRKIEVIRIHKGATKISDVRIDVNKDGEVELQYNQS